MTLPPTAFYFLRHGVTDHNQRRLVMGQMDIPLNEVGRQQARQAADQLAELGIGRIFSSPLARALETAQIIARRLDLSVGVVDGLKERDWGEMSGHTYRELMQIRQTPKGAESLEEFSERILGALAVLPPEGTALVVSHSGLCRVLRRRLGIADDQKPVPNAVPIHFAPDPKGRWNEDILLAEGR